ncbi:hypothetical protein [Bradyrhizobium sp.]|uniref:hypothetical protein n=1 Tax=Bradyrhizobium sp. TaxID=376 RepID=UPI0027222B57|nr:hypothetical protein [Bradyrhizobium sp.]MDO9298495.1 hypothetical protein [Bradyrhizobium sp.]
MTSISAAASSSYLSPLQQLQKELQSEVTAGKITSADQDALSAALTDIDASLQSSRPSHSAGTRPSPEDMKAKIDDLIAGEVSSGKLTSEQATELQGVFEAAFANGPGGGGGPGGPRGGGPGGPGGPPPADDLSATGSADSTTDATSADDLLQQFLELLQDSLSASSSTSYSATGSTATSAGKSSSSFSALLIDYQS